MFFNLKTKKSFKNVNKYNQKIILFKNKLIFLKEFSKIKNNNTKKFAKI